MSKPDLIEISNFEIKDLNCKYVTYFGYKLYVPIWATWISTDKNGQVWVYINKPHIGVNRYVFGCGSPIDALNKIKFDGDWRTSLMQIKS